MIRFRRRGVSAEGLVCIEMHPDGIGLARLLETTSERPRLSLCDFHASEDGDPAVSAVRQIREQEAAGARGVVALSPELYSLHLVDAPDVQPEEIAASARWMIRDLIDFPVDEAVVDYFEVPQQQRGEGPRRIYVVAARSEIVKSVIGLVDRCSLHLEAIEVTETGLGHLAHRITRDGEGLALVRLGARDGLIEMTRGRVLQMVRRLESGLEGLTRVEEPWPDEPIDLDGGHERYDSLLLEIQRSLDYYESQLGEPPVSTLWLAPFEESLPDLLPFLEKNLTVDVRALDFAELLDFDTPAPPVAQARCLAALGAGLGAIRGTS